jgi:hypothetical protein
MHNNEALRPAGYDDTPAGSSLLSLVDIYMQLALLRTEPGRALAFVVRRQFRGGGTHLEGASHSQLPETSSEQRP